MAVPFRMTALALLLAAAPAAGLRAETAVPAWPLRGAVTDDAAALASATGDTAPSDATVAAEAEDPAPPPAEADDGPLGRAEGPAGRAGAVAPEGPAAAIGRGGRRAADETAYDPLGLRVGSFLMFPAVELRGGYASNAAGAAGGGASGLLEVAPEVVFRSQWARHAATLSLRGGVLHALDGGTGDRPTVSIEAGGRIDLPAEWTLALRAGYDYAREDLSSADYPDGADRPPGVHRLAAGAALDGRIGRVVLGLRSAVDGRLYEDAEIGGVAVSQKDRDNAAVSGTLRLGYAVVPGLVPFVEAEASRRIYAERRDADGIARASRGVALRAGLAYDAAPVTTAEIALGWRREDFDDDALSSLEAFTIDGSIVWSPTRLTTVRLAGSTAIEPSTDPGTSGAVVYDTTLSIERALRRNLTAELFGGWRAEEFGGAGADTTTWTAGVGARWKLNRSLWVTGRFTQTWFESAAAAADYRDSRVLVGLRLQR
ncbi:outer membrane beta-barrel protein [Prosthecomicrobium pneumaticum]|uniref:Outer membrane protein beta-barrel domain-containing protein n=1 Tax=Prosthecomicrobium pneumaticum TaxID=81895 RepID=A0A7W9CVY3_9HYPH|nr:outer membrane beta-barrel protein [Prosthecomicrobium pneumaticum]MBB5752526.1 hypothetical protein [Prosthecomicrobium pneumaticum]